MGEVSLYDNIPHELKVLRQWVVYKDGKVPYQASNPNYMAKVNEPNTWADFNTAVAAINAPGVLGIGFVFSISDPYSFIDLDDAEGSDEIYQRQIALSEAFGSYQEVSPSGKGLHIIVKGSVPHGRRREKTEVYFKDRYATFTGRVYKNNPIEERQALLDQLYSQLGEEKPATQLVADFNQTISDDEVIALALKHNVTFNDLMNGVYQHHSESQATMALMNMLWVYSKNDIQCKRIFMRSAFGQSEKIKKRPDYLMDRMLNRAKDQTLPPVDIEYTKIKLDDALHNIKAAEPPTKQNCISVPPGLVGKIAEFIYAAAPRPVPEIALAGALGLMAGICGRAYNVSGTGLNQYVLVLADTGTGKEAAASGIDKLMSKIAFTNPTSIDYIGPSEISSGIALIRQLAATPCFVSILGEFGIRLQSMSSQSASYAEISLRRILLDLYNKSGKADTFRGSVYADKDKNVNSINSPSFSILGESTPQRFYGALTENMISEGLLPRFTIIEYIGPRPPLNKHHLRNSEPSGELVSLLSDVTFSAAQIMHSKEPVAVQFSNEALKIAERFDEHADKKINAVDSDALKQLWNRAHIKAIKLAGLIAVGVNHIKPVIQDTHILWAIDIINFDIERLSKKFEKGEVGLPGNQANQVNELIKFIRNYYLKPFSDKASYAKYKPYHDNKMLPYSYVYTLMNRHKAFGDERDTRAAIKRTLDTLCESRTLDKIVPGDKRNIGLMEAYILLDNSVFSDD